MRYVFHRAAVPVLRSARSLGKQGVSARLLVISHSCLSGRCRTLSVTAIKACLELSLPKTVRRRNPAKCQPSKKPYQSAVQFVHCAREISPWRLSGVLLTCDTAAKKNAKCGASLRYSPDEQGTYRKICFGMPCTGSPQDATT